jgi:hypothetical protein
MEDDKKLKIAAVVGGGVLAIGLIYYFLSESEDEKMKRELHRDMDKLNSVSKDSSGTIKVQDFIELFKIITKFSKLKIKKIKRENGKQRRKAINDEETYRELVTSQIKEEEEIYQEYANLVLENFNIQENDFLIAQQVHMGNPLFQKTMISIQHDLEDLAKFKPPVSKDKAKEIFMYVEEAKFNAMDKITKQQEFGSGSHSDTTITLLVEHSKIEDNVYEKFGIESDDLQK